MYGIIGTAYRIEIALRTDRHGPNERRDEVGCARVEKRDDIDGNRADGVRITDGASLGPRVVARFAFASGWFVILCEAPKDVNKISTIRHFDRPAS